MKSKILAEILYFFSAIVPWCLSAIETPDKLSKIVEKTGFAKLNEPYFFAYLERIESIEGNNYPFYKFYLYNMPLKKGQKFVLMNRNCLGDTVKMADAYVDDQLELVLVFPNKKNEIRLSKFQFFLSKMNPGENMDIILASEDLSKSLTAHIVINPLEAVSKTNQKICLELRAFYGMLYECIGEGYSSNEQLKVISSSCNEEESFFINANEDGTFNFFIMPATINKTEGFATVTVLRKCGDALKITYPWGYKNTRPHHIEK